MISTSHLGLNAVSPSNMRSPSRGIRVELVPVSPNKKPKTATNEYKLGRFNLLSTWDGNPPMEVQVMKKMLPALKPAVTPAMQGEDYSNVTEEKVLKYAKELRAAAEAQPAQVAYMYCPNGLGASAHQGRHFRTIHDYAKEDAETMGKSVNGWIGDCNKFTEDIVAADDDIRNLEIRLKAIQAELKSKKSERDELQDAKDECMTKLHQTIHEQYCLTTLALAVEPLAQEEDRDGTLAPNGPFADGRVSLSEVAETLGIPNTIEELETKAKKGTSQAIERLLMLIRTAARLGLLYNRQFRGIWLADNIVWKWAYGDTPNIILRPKNLRPKPQNPNDPPPTVFETVAERIFDYFQLW